MKKILLLGVLTMLLGAGCGYRTPGAGDAWVGQGGRSLYVELFSNRTVEPYLDSIITEEVSMQFSRSRLVGLSESRGTADLILGGAVTGFGSSVAAYDADDEISEYRAYMTVAARLVRRSDGAVLWQGELQRSEIYPAMLDKNLQKEGEGVAARIVAKRIAEDLMARLLLSF